MRLRAAAGSLLLAGTVACAINVPAPRQASAEPDVQAADSSRAGEAWARLLSRHVDAEGRIDFRGLAAAPADLETMAAWIASVSPRSSPSGFPASGDVLAWYVNAYNALAMYNVIRSGIPTDLEPIKVRFFYRDRLLMGGERISLYALENDLVRPLGDPRIHFALNCMVRACPRLPREPFEAARLDAQLDAAAKLFVSELRNVEPVPDRRVVRLSEIFRFYTKDFLARAPSLIAYVNLYREEKIPDDWKVEFIPYDWTVNASPP